MDQSSAPPHDLPPMSRTIQLALAYALLGSGWIAGTDLLLNALSAGAHLQTLKGWIYVALTTAAFYLFLRKSAHRLRQWESALKSSQASREAFANASPDLMFELARDGTFLGYKAAPMGLNQPAEVFMGRRIQDVLPQIAPQTLEAIERATSTGALQVFHYRLPLGDILHEYEARVISSGADRVVAIVRDVTEQRTTEDALRRAVRAYRLLSESNQIIVRATDEIALLRDICRVAVTSGQFRLAWVGYARDSAARTIEPVASYESDDNAPGVLATWAGDPGGDCPAGRAIRTGQPVVVPDCAGDPALAPWRSENLKRGYRSALALPLAADDRVFGVLAIYAGEVDAFQHGEEIALLEELARDLAWGISALRTRAERERARQAEREQRVLAEALSDTAIALNGSLDLEQVLDHILENIRGVVPHDTASILLIEGESVWMARHAGFNERGLGGQIDGLRFDDHALEKYQIMRQTRQPVVIDDTAHSELWAPVSGTEWIRASVWAPIFYADEFIGVISLDSATPGFFTAGHAGRLRAFAAQAAIAIRNARLFQAEHEQRSLAEALQDTATIINSALDLDAVTDHILDNLKRVLPHDSASLLLIEDGVARAVRHRGFEERGLGDWLAGARFPIAGFPTLRQMFDTCEPLIIANTATYPDWITFPEIAWIRSYAAAPIHREGRVIGYLQVESVQPDFFNAQHAEHLQTFADQAAIALQNARLYQAAQEHAAVLQAQAQRLALVNRVSTHVAHQLELDTIYRTVLLELQAAFGASFGGLVLFEEDRVGRLVLGTHPEDTGQGNVTIALERNPSIDIVRATHKPLVSEDVLNDPVFEPAWPVLRRRGTRTLLIVPLVVGDGVIGTLGLDWVEPRQFTSDELELAETIANQASLAITKAQLYIAERDQRVLAEALGHVAALSNRSPALEDLFDELLENVGRVITYDAGNVMLFDQHGAAQIVRHTGYNAFGLADWLDGLRLTAEQSPHWSRVHQTGRPQPYIIGDTQRDPDWSLLPESSWIRSTLKAPISVEGRVIGLLNLDSATPHHFRPIDAERLQAFADQVALAIQNARLFQAERDQRTLAEALQAAAAAVSSTLQFDLVLDRILANVGQVLPHDAANIMLIEEGVARVARGYGYAEHGAGAWIGQVRFEVNKVPIWQTMLATRQPFALSDTHADPRWLRLPEEEWIRSTVKAPIVLEGQVIGILHLDSEQPGFFDAIHAARLQAFADQAAIAIRNAQLYDAVQHHASELEQRVLERTAEVEAQRAQLQAVLDSMGEAVIFTRGGEVIYVNAAFSALLGYNPAELMHRPFDLIESLIAPAPEVERLRGAIRSGLAQNRSWRGTVAAHRRDGAIVDSALTITQVPGQDGTGDAGLVALFRDISQEKALQAQKDRFIAHASHELRTPLANIKTRLYLLRKQPDKLQAHLDVINRVTDSMTELIENLLDISRFERGVIPLYCQPVALAELIEEVIAIQQPEAERKDITLRASLPGQPLVIDADPQRISQVITNLVNNAINYTGEGGTITIELAPVDPGDHGSARQAAIRVCDTGIGIPAEMLSQVFEPFFRANEDVAAGTGLGLTIAREIVHLHHGSIAVDSAVGQGTVFTVTLDLLESSQEHNNRAISD
ncbi:MAG: GAF domain-containing protein [Anaerolineae bacterium]|nr:GAF domain-containing protein [Anaerolineae bacterium]